MIKHQVLTIFLTVIFGFRAQKRIAQQRIDSRIPLGKLIDLRKKIYANVKVCISALLEGSFRPTVLLELREPGFTNR